ncbi:MAG: HAMP domain-containing histidine kinase [Deltaproteobacteria bacterium]|nr:HAMP domain-containing histidine kinase [Deltaproteobacteria bacterium]
MSHQKPRNTSPSKERRGKKGHGNDTRSLRDLLAEKERRIAELEKEIQEAGGPSSAGDEADKEREILQKRLMEIQKIEAIGTFVAGMIHNIIGPLSAIRGTAELTESILQDTPFEKDAGSNEMHKAEARRLFDENIRIIISNVDQIKRVIDAILIRIKGDQIRTRESLDVNEIIRNELAILENDLFFKHHVLKNIRLANGLPPFKGLYTDISQCLYNLFRNAVEAMKSSPRPELSVASTCDDRHIWITVKDRGEGIPSEIIPRIFDPFFSTKHFRTDNDHIQGCGLGLYTVKQILAPYGALMEVNSQAGETVFRIGLPREESNANGEGL